MQNSLDFHCNSYSCYSVVCTTTEAAFLLSFPSHFSLAKNEVLILHFGQTCCLLLQTSTTSQNCERVLKCLFKCKLQREKWIIKQSRNINSCFPLPCWKAFVLWTQKRIGPVLGPYQHQAIPSLHLAEHFVCHYLNADICFKFQCMCFEANSAAVFPYCLEPTAPGVWHLHILGFWKLRKRST